jgi:hypothetical protein
MIIPIESKRNICRLSLGTRATPEAVLKINIADHVRSLPGTAMRYSFQFKAVACRDAFRAPGTKSTKRKSPGPHPQSMSLKTATADLWLATPNEFNEGRFFISTHKRPADKS